VTKKALCATWFVLASMVGCGASINPQLKASIDRRNAALSQRDTHHEAPTTAEPAALEVGQWVQYRMINEEREVSFTTQKIVGRVGTAYWIELVSETYYGTTALLMLAELGNRTDPEQIDVQRLIQKHDDDEPMEDALTLSMLRGSYRSMLADLSISWQGLAQEDASSPAGHFAQAYRKRVEVSALGMTRVSDVWLHPAVPVNGSVRSVGIDYQGTMELIDFGTNATSVIPIPAH
jgi:hypothetical protein